MYFPEDTLYTWTVSLTAADPPLQAVHYVGVSLNEGYLFWGSL